MLKKVKIISSALVSSGIALFTNKTFAATVNPGLVDKPLEGYIKDALSLAIWAAGVLSVAFIIIGGFQYITAGASKDGATKAKTTLTYAIVGLIIVFLALVIRNYVLGSLGIDKPPL